VEGAGWESSIGRGAEDWGAGDGTRRAMLYIFGACEADKFE
jgi:hypothetical protein